MKITIIVNRLLLDLALFILAFMAPWWLSFTIAIIGLVIFKNFAEIFFVGLVIDTVQFDGRVGMIPFLFLIISLLLFIGVSKIRPLFFEWEN